MSCDTETPCPCGCETEPDANETHCVCGKSFYERGKHPETCPKILAHKKKYCMASPIPGQMIDGWQEPRIATGDETCILTRARCNGNHRNFVLGVTWTDTPTYLHCSICTKQIGLNDVKQGQPNIQVGFDGGKTREGFVCDTCSKLYQNQECEWQGDRLVPRTPAPKCGVRPDPYQMLKSPHTFLITYASGDEQCGLDQHHAGEHQCAANGDVWGWTVQTPETIRRDREKELAALVNDVPPTLDPIGWCAVVLLHAEGGWSMAKVRASLRVAKDILLGELILEEDSSPTLKAYRRALAPRSVVAPERHGTTWKTRGPFFSVDDGRDE